MRCTSNWHFAASRLCLAVAVLAGSACCGEAAVGETHPVYVKKGGWTETMLATRGKYLQSPEGMKQGPASGVFKPYDSGLLRGDGPAQHVALNVSGVKVLCLMAFCEQGTANCNIWGEPKLIAKDGTETKLTSLKPASVRVGWGEYLVDKNWQSHQLQIGDRKFLYGIWVHANSEVRFSLDGKYERFEAYVGEDKDRANGTLRFKLTSGEAAQLPPFWGNMTRDYPVQAGWLVDDAGMDALTAYFANRDSAAQEQDIIGRVLAQVAPGGASLKGELDGLAQAKAPPSDSRWLDLYARACRYRECAALLREFGKGEPRAGLEKDVEALAATKVSAEDAKWQDLRSRITQYEEVERQYKMLHADLQQRGTFQKLAKETYRTESMILPEDRDPTDVILRRTAALLADLKKTDAAPKLAACEEQLAKLQKCSADTPLTNADARRALFAEACKVRRQIAFSNPLLNFDQILFIKRHRALYDHMCDQFYGMAATPGGGLYVLSNPFGTGSQQQTEVARGTVAQVRDVLASSTVAKGRLAGQRLSGGPSQPPRLSFDGGGNLSGDEAQGGSFLSPSLSYDGKQILFAYVECKGDRRHRHHTDASRGHWDEGHCYHVFKVNVDGSGLEQLTDGTWNDFDPCWLPNGRVAFISERRGGYLRCGRVCPTYTLYDMAADGTDINCLSFHETNEWNPSVTHDGRIIYTRWDYVDRHGCVAHLPWITTLDGTDSRALHGNFAPRQLRPDMELSVRAVPNSHKYLALAAPHHGQAFGSVVLIDPHVPDDDAMAPVKRVTPEVGFPESQGGAQVYGTPWPLSDDYYLCVYDPAMQPGTGVQGGRYVRGNYAIYLVDSFGNKELIYRDPDIGCMSPMPLRPTKMPPATPAPGTVVSKSVKKAVTPGDTGEATLACINVYQSIKPWPEGAKIKELRVLQLLPCSVPTGGPPHETGKRIAEAGDSVVPARWVLGTVPVEEDGSVHFTVPANREMFFQALDERGLAIQSMRSATYLRDGERLVCLGCHEPKHSAPTMPKATPLALQREPSKLKPDVDGSNPFSYPRLVQPVLDRACVKCHAESPKKPCNLAKDPIQNKWYASYNSLVNYGFTAYNDGYRTTPGKFGAKASKLYALLTKGHYDVKLSDEDFHRLMLWVDCSSMFYGVFEKETGEAQLRGEIAKPTLE
ncbi:MAG: NPCBM/NEW2 domain-containing protein [Planctomycetota bacterium]|nr:NPCBM/NEW2 domain-containing protein [Planctomycetota bacterium]